MSNLWFIRGDFNVVWKFEETTGGLLVLDEDDTIFHLVIYLKFIFKKTLSPGGIVMCCRLTTLLILKIMDLQV